MGDRVEVALRIRVDEDGITVFEQSVDAPQRVFTTASGTKAVAVLGTVLLLKKALQKNPWDDFSTMKSQPVAQKHVAAVETVCFSAVRN